METPDARQLSLPEKIGYIYRTARDEHGDAPALERTATYATIGGLSFEWGTGNEALLGMVGGNLHQATDNPLLTGIATGAVSFAEQSTIGMLMATTIASYPSVAAAVREITVGGKGSESVRQSKMSRFLSVMILGSAVEVAKENAVRSNTRRENIRRAIANAGIIGVANTALIAATSAGAVIAEDQGFEAQAETAVQIASNPLTYAGLLGVALGIGKVKKIMRERREKKNISVIAE